MKSLRSFTLSTSLVLVCLMALPAHSEEFKKRQKVWSKHHETPLLAEPKPLAAVELTVDFGQKLTIREVQGTWLRVDSKQGEGWVFQGNVASKKPKIAPTAGWTRVDAAQTDAVAAARPLTPAAKDYAQRHGAGDAQTDLDWLDAEAAEVSMEDTIAFMSENQLGEYQQ
jgi:hypothetical protein